MNKSELLNRINNSWTNLWTFINGLTEAQMTIPADAAGWTVKDHLSHLAAWEDSISILFNSQLCQERMGIDADIWRADDIDAINDVIYQHEKDKPLVEVLNTMKSNHARIIAQLEALSEVDLQKPMPDVQRDSWVNRPISDWIISDTYEHYDEHLPWMDRIAHQR